MSDLISRQAAIDALDGEIEITGRTNAEAVKGYVRLVRDRLERLPSARPDFCKYCNEDADGFVTPLEKNGHAFVRFGMNGWELSLGANGWRGSAKIRYCPMCGRDLFVK